MLHKVRLLLNRQLGMLTNAIRAHVADFGVVASVGRAGGARSTIASVPKLCWRGVLMNSILGDETFNALGRKHLEIISAERGGRVPCF